MSTNLQKAFQQLDSCADYIAAARKDLDNLTKKLDELTAQSNAQAETILKLEKELNELNIPAPA